MSKKPKTPLTIVVSEDRYDVFGDANSFWHAYLKAMLTLNGGINETVTPGIYTFTVEVRGFKRYVILKPKSDF